ncbi:MAG: hypothetical protein K2Q15_10510 [Burkholderiales bacterium]|nr:hypothetical protein [Burkholderiales bacterium]
MKAAKLADLKAFWVEFYVASHVEVAVVADFDEAMIKKPIGQAIWQLE